LVYGRHVANVCNRKIQYSLEIPNHYISGNLITDVFGESFTLNDTSSISQRSILCPKNEEVMEINDKVLESLISEKSPRYSSFDLVNKDDGNYTMRICKLTFQLNI